MSKTLRQLLGAKEPVYSLRIGALEAATGRHKIDLSFLSDIMSSARVAITELGLDPNDTTAVELWSALQTRAKRDDEELKKSVRGDQVKLIDKIQRKHPGTEIPVASHAALKKLLSKSPPKKVMAALGYRSAESMLKRAPLEQLLLGAFMLESISWHRSFASAIKKLTTSDITMSRPKAVLIDKRLLAKSRYKHLVSVQVAGLVGIPQIGVQKGSYIFIASYTAEGLFHVHVRGQLLKIFRFSDDFFKRLAHYTYTTPEAAGEIGKVAVPWISVYHYLSHNPAIADIIGDGEVSHQDFAWKVPSQVIPLLSTRIHSWEASEFAGVVNHEHTISLNISDIAYDLLHLIPLSHSTQRSLRRSLSTALIARYLTSAPHRDRLMNKVGISV